MLIFLPNIAKKNTYLAEIKSGNYYVKCYEMRPDVARLVLQLLPFEVSLRMLL